MQLTMTHEAPGRGPAFVKALHNDTRMSWFWLPFRVFAGYLWLEASLHKVNDPKWVQTGDALQEFWQKSLALGPKPIIEVGGYRDFIQYLRTRLQNAAAVALQCERK